MLDKVFKSACCGADLEKHPTCGLCKVCVQCGKKAVAILSQ